MQGKTLLQIGPRPIIRKLIRQGSVFTCSLCRTPYSDRGEAFACLSSCWDDLASVYPVYLLRRPGQKSHYRCHYCSRDYEGEAEALSCAEACRHRIDLRHEREQAIDKILPLTPKRPRRLALITQAGFSSRSQGPALVRGKHAVAQSSGSTGKVEASEVTTHVPAAAQAVAAEQASPAYGEKASPRKARSKMSFAKPYVRHNAKYKCACCNTLYFTKMETETCFNGHFDEEGFEIETTPSPTV